MGNTQVQNSTMSLQTVSSCRVDSKSNSVLSLWKFLGRPVPVDRKSCSVASAKLLSTFLEQFVQIGRKLCSFQPSHYGKLLKDFCHLIKGVQNLARNHQDDFSFGYILHLMYAFETMHLRFPCWLPIGYLEQGWHSGKARSQKLRSLILKEKSFEASFF